MILSRVSIQRPILATMMNLALVLFGAIGLSRLPVRELPDIDPPIVSVTTVYPGANAQVVENNGRVAVHAARLCIVWRKSTSRKA